MPYTEISQSEFEKVLSESGKWEQIHDNQSKENIYLLDGNIKIYSSIVSGHSRGVGEDAVRVIAVDNISQLPVKSSESRVYRTENWATHLKERIAKVKSFLNTVKKCKTCGGMLVERENRTTHEKFMGCLNYKNHGNHNNTKGLNTNNTNHGNGVESTSPSLFSDELATKKEPPIPSVTQTGIASDTMFVCSPPIKPKVPNKYQEIFFEFIRNGSGHCVLKSAAGSGKTYSIEEATKYVPPGKSILFIAFNRSITEELKRHAPPNVDAVTFHGLGYRACAFAYGNVQRDINKQRKIIDQLLLDRDLMSEISNTCPPEFLNDVISDIKNTVNKLCSHVKGRLIQITEENITYLLDYYGIETLSDVKLLTKLTLVAIELSKLNTREVNYDDMVWLPVVNNLSLKKYDFIFIDECQDTNPANLELVMRSLKPSGRVIAVGDGDQAIYAFRSADAEAMQTIAKRLNATELKLSITYRCPKSHVRLAQQLVPEIEAASDAIEGILKDISMEEFYEIVKPGDMVLCRNNAPLVEPAFALLGRGIKVCIRGRDIGEGLITLIKKLKAKNMDDFYTKLSDWRDHELARCTRDDASPELVEDKYAVLNFLSAECDDINCIIQKIKSIFSDEIAAVTFSSIHKSKGLENSVVFILEPSLMPSKYATKEWEMTQEKNVMYIAYTRSRDKLFLVSKNSSI